MSDADRLKTWLAVAKRLEVELLSESTAASLLPQLSRELDVVQARIDALQPAKSAAKSRAPRAPKGVVSLAEAKRRRTSRESAPAVESGAAASGSRKRGG